MKDLTIANFIAQSAFAIWKEQEFRSYVSFSSLSQTEQDRIFNELQVTLLGLVLLYAEEYLKPHIAKSTVEEFLELLASGGIEKKYIEIWQKLILLRFDEYRKDYIKAVKNAQKREDYKRDEDVTLAWIRVETLAIDALSHIRRGAVVESDKLWPYLRQWLLAIDVHLSRLLKKISMVKTEKN